MVWNRNLLEVVTYYPQLYETIMWYVRQWTKRGLVKLKEKNNKTQTITLEIQFCTCSDVSDVYNNINISNISYNKYTTLDHIPLKKKELKFESLLRKTMRKKEKLNPGLGCMEFFICLLYCNAQYKAVFLRENVHG